METTDQVAGLRMLGCPVGQGFYFSPPLRAAEFHELLTRHFARNPGPSGPALIAEGSNAPGITTLSSLLARPGDAVTLPG